MSTEAPEAAPPQPAGDSEGGERPESAAGAEETAEAGDEQVQDAWAARRDLADHTPRSMRFGARTRFDGGQVDGDNHGITAGQIVGDVTIGGKTEVHYQFGTSTHSAGEVPEATLERLASHFVADRPAFEALAESLRTKRVLVLSGAHFSGRRTAALMLLHQLGVSPVRALDRSVHPSELARQLGAGGHLVCDLITGQDRPLREADLLAARDKLAEQDAAYLVITVDPRAALEDIEVVEWQPPSPAHVLEAHLRTLVPADDVPALLALPAVKEFLGRGHQLREAAAYARELARYATGQAQGRDIERFSLAALESQVQEWFEQAEASLHLRDKSFLVALAAFDGGPYALTAELSDLLYGFLQKTENPHLPPTVPVFGTHIGKRLQLARAERYREDEHTEWGPVPQWMAAFQDERAPLVLLREVWTGHPSARPALVAWLRRLATDGRPFVRTRAAATVAVLAYTDLPSAMALVIGPWAASNRFLPRQSAAFSLTLAHDLGTPHVPRIIDSWCTGDDWRLSWVAIRAHGLIGPERPAQALAALRAAARRQAGYEEPHEILLEELAASVQLLILSTGGHTALAELVRTLRDDRAVFDLAVNGFLGACLHTGNDEPYGRPLVLDLFARARQEQDAAAAHIAELWRAALGDLGHTEPALEVLRNWVLTADRDQATEWALAALLPALVTTAPELARLDHLLRTMPGEDGAPPPPAAGRLLTVLPRA
ncbi:hypothetical protein [Streptomyces mesophilus]|uniref:hypothetical protein n=1 Tax=Streptomyces mesophilus TaxID=1775132 RepID=UPI00332B143C